MTANSYKCLEGGVEFCKDTTLAPWSPLTSTSFDYMADMQLWTGTSWTLWKNYTINTSDASGDYCSVTWDNINNRSCFN